MFFLIFSFSLGICRLQSQDKMYFATATDTEHYTWTLNLIAGIHRCHDDNVGEIGVFDLGLNAEERSFLERLSYVKVYDVEPVNPYIFQRFTVVKEGKIARGLYSWKPVVIKQALDLYPVVFYLDSGISVVGSFDLLFKHVRENHYLLIDCGHSIRRMTSKPLIKQFALDQAGNAWVLDQMGISSGIQGLSKDMYANYVCPIYHMAFSITNFIDDGACPGGYGFGRYDQTLFSIQARLLRLTVNKVLQGGKLRLQIEGKTTKVRLDKFLEITRGSFDLDKVKKYIRYKTLDEEKALLPVQ